MKNHIHFISVLILISLFLLVMHLTPAFSQTVRQDSITLNANLEWHLIGIPGTFVDWSLAQLAASNCGGATGGWISYGWMFKDNEWLLVKGSDPGLSELLTNVQPFSADHAGLGLWIRLNTALTQNKVCTLSCGSTSCSSAPPTTTTTIPLGTNLIANPGFETRPDGSDWILPSGEWYSGDWHGGSYSLRLVGPPSTVGLGVPSTKCYKLDRVSAYKASAWIKIDDQPEKVGEATLGVNLYINEDCSSFDSFFDTSTSSRSWTQLSREFSSGLASAAQIVLRKDSVDSALFDDVELVKVR